MPHPRIGFHDKVLRCGSGKKHPIKGQINCLLKEDPTIATYLRLALVAGHRQHEPYCQVNTLSILGSKAIQTRILVNPLKFLSNLQSARKGLKSGVIELINGGIKSRKQI